MGIRPDSRSLPGPGAKSIISTGPTARTSNRPPADLELRAPSPGKRCNTCQAPRLGPGIAAEGIEFDEEAWRRSDRDHQKERDFRAVSDPWEQVGNSSSICRTRS